MKSERRHELQHNTLDTELARGVQFFRDHGTRILWGVLIVAFVALAVVFFVRRSRTAAVQQAQVLYNSIYVLSMPGGDLGEAGPLLELAETSDGREAALAAVAAGDYYAQLLLNRISGAIEGPQREAADSARNWYTRAIDSYSGQDEAVAKAHLGLARLEETLGNPQAAREHYQAIVDQQIQLEGQPTLLFAQLALQSEQALEGFQARMAVRPAAGTQPATTAPAETAPAEPTTAEAS
jgi:hypothetical protein